MGWQRPVPVRLGANLSQIDVNIGAIPRRKRRKLDRSQIQQKLSGTESTGSTPPCPDCLRCWCSTRVADSIEKEISFSAEGSMPFLITFPADVPFLDKLQLQIFLFPPFRRQTVRQQLEIRLKQLPANTSHFKSIEKKQKKTKQQHINVARSGSPSSARLIIYESITTVDWMMAMEVNSSPSRS